MVWELESVFQILQLLRLGDLNLSNSILNINISNLRVLFPGCLDTSWEWKLLVLPLPSNFPSRTVLPESLWYEFCMPMGQGRWRRQGSPF